MKEAISLRGRPTEIQIAVQYCIRIVVQCFSSRVHWSVTFRCSSYVVSAHCSEQYWTVGCALRLCRRTRALWSCARAPRGWRSPFCRRPAPRRRPEEWPAATHSTWALPPGRPPAPPSNRPSARLAHSHSQSAPLWYAMHSLTEIRYDTMRYDTRYEYTQQVLLCSRETESTQTTTNPINYKLILNED